MSHIIMDSAAVEPKRTRADRELCLGGDACVALSCTQGSVHGCVLEDALPPSVNRELTPPRHRQASWVCSRPFDKLGRYYRLWNLVLQWFYASRLFLWLWLWINLYDVLLCNAGALVVQWLVYRLIEAYGGIFWRWYFGIFLVNWIDQLFYCCKNW
jgi:hypothetical protein